MIERRKFHRVKFSTKIILSQNDTLHHGRLENISKNGALVRLESGAHLSKESEYALSVYLEGDEHPLQFSVELVNFTFDIAGIKFVAYDSETETETRFDVLLEMLASKVDNEMVEQKKYQRRLTENYHREGNP